MKTTKNVKYEIVELSETPVPVQVDYTKILDDINKVCGCEEFGIKDCYADYRMWVGLSFVE